MKKIKKTINIFFFIIIFFSITLSSVSAVGVVWSYTDSTSGYTSAFFQTADGCNASLTQYRVNHPIASLNCVSSFTAAVGTWSYKESTDPSANTSASFQTIDECNANRAQYIATHLVINPTPCSISSDIPVPITGQKTTGPTDVYTLLAPIGELTTAPTNVGDYFNTIFLIAIGLCGALAVIMIVIGGIQYMGDESIFGKTEAKGKITSAILGLLIALGAYALLNTINPDLLGKGGINIKQVSAAIDDSPILVESSAPTTGVAVGTKGLCTGGLSPVVIGGTTIMHTCTSITAKITNLINTAASQGIVLRGKSYRSNADQMALRVKNCVIPLTTPSNQCVPPTAIAGTSMHESGLAIDFQCEGQSIQTKDNKCFIWLSQNAGTFGLINLAKEPWHWSTTGT